MDNSQEKSCIKCGNKSFEYDEYFNEYSCQYCGWILDATQTVDNSKGRSCIKCGNKSFEYDKYFNEYSCQYCGWILDAIQKNDQRSDSNDYQGSNPENTEAEIARLNEIIIDLRQKGKQAVTSRDKWKKRAELAERKQHEQSQNNDYKFKQVKKMFSKMYHPDSVTGDRFEKLIKQEIFKEFWQIIENIEK